MRDANNDRKKIQFAIPLVFTDNKLQSVVYLSFLSSAELFHANGKANEKLNEKLNGSSWVEKKHHSTALKSFMVAFEISVIND